MNHLDLYFYPPDKTLEYVMILSSELTAIQFYCTCNKTDKYVHKERFVLMGRIGKGVKSGIDRIIAETRKLKFYVAQNTMHLKL